MCTEWCREMQPAQIKLLYLLAIPQSLAELYPKCNQDKTAVEATPTAEVKWGMEAAMVAARIDVLPTHQGSGKAWVS